MHLDALTLMAANGFVAVIGTVLLVGAWTQMRPAPALALWAGAEAANAAGVALLAFGFAGAGTIVQAAGSGAIVLGAALVWMAARSFQGRRASPLIPASLLVLWLAGCLGQVAGGLRFADNPSTFTVTAFALVAAALELWRGRGEALSGRYPLIGILVLHAAIFAGAIVDILRGNGSSADVPAVGSWFGLIHFEQMIFLIGSAILLMVMARQRVEQRSLSAAHVDALTGVANRGAFFTRAERAWRRARENGAPVAVIAFDVDHFKAVNDTYGHAGGDRVLRAFSETVSALLRPGDICGRIGGEEFAAVLPGTGIAAGYVIADRIRHAFETMPQETGGGAVRVTVSAGVAVSGPGDTLDTTLAAADRALYRAKEGGRNRVERAAEQLEAPGSNVIRVA